MEKIYHNSLLKKETELLESKKVISKLNIKDEEAEGYDNFVKNFIDLKTFPYINTEYANIIEDEFEDLEKVEKLQIIGHIESLIKDFDDAIINYINKNEIDVIRDKFFYEGWVEEKKDEIISTVRGGEYAEMLLNQILINNGFMKVISKLSQQWGRLSPTGIDIVYANLEEKKLVLMESKFYKKYNDALKSVDKDLKDIIDGTKLDNELLEWKKRLKQMPEEIQTWYIDMIDSNKNNKEGLLEYFEEINVIGFVMANKDKNYNRNFEEYKHEYKNNSYKVLLISVPIISKDKFISSCLTRLDEIKVEI